jgi:hypothetical protein
MIVLAFSMLSISLSYQDNALNELFEAEKIAIEAEQVNFVRSLLEENTDFIVEGILLEEALLCDSSPGNAKQRINQALVAYFEEMQKGVDGIEIEFANASNGFLNQNSSLVVKRLGPSCKIKYSFHGGLLKNQPVLAEVRGKEVVQQFKVPVGYSQEKEVWLHV